MWRRFRFGRGFVVDRGRGVHTQKVEFTPLSLCTPGILCFSVCWRLHNFTVTGGRDLPPWLFFLLFPPFSEAILFLLPDGTIPNQSIRTE